MKSEKLWSKSFAFLLLYSIQLTFQSLKIEQQFGFLSYALKRSRLSVLTLPRYDTLVKMCPCLHRKEVIQPHLPIRLPCYDLTPVIESTLDSCLLAVSSLALGVPNSHGLTGGVYKARERIHRGMLIRDY